MRQTRRGLLRTTGATLGMGGLAGYNAMATGSESTGIRGSHGYYCAPHEVAGMVGTVVVGE